MDIANKLIEIHDGYFNKTLQLKENLLSEIIKLPKLTENQYSNLLSNFKNIIGSIDALNDNIEFFMNNLDFKNNNNQIVYDLQQSIIIYELLFKKNLQSDSSDSDSVSVSVSSESVSESE